MLIVGAGPSGLSAAYHLRMLGHAVTIYDAGELPGGMIRFGIPAYRLPRDVLQAEIERILALGVELECSHKVTDIRQAMAEGGFDAAFLAVGAHIAKRAYIPAGEAAHVLDAISLLREMEGAQKPMLGRRVVIYGGGDTAMDAARTAKRLGASDAIVVYRRTRERMPAHDVEVEEALEEGVRMKWLSSIRHAREGSLVLERMELDEDGFPQPTGQLEELEADSLVLALGQEADLSLLEGVTGLEVQDGVVKVAPEHDDRPRRDLRGRRHGAGRALGDRRLGHGKAAARHIDAWLRQDAYRGRRRELATFDMLNTWYYADAPHAERAAPRRRPPRSTFDEVVIGLDESKPCSRPVAACPAAAASPATTATASARTTR